MKKLMTLCLVLIPIAGNGTLSWTRGPSGSMEALIVGDAEATAAQDAVALAAEGRALLFGRTQANDETTFGIVVFQAEDDARADATMASDPAVQGGVMTATLHPFRVAGMAGSS